MPTSLKPFISNRLMISPMMPLCTPSGLMARKVRSFSSAMILKGKQTNKKKKLDEDKKNLNAICRRSEPESHSRHLVAFGTGGVGAGSRGPRPHCLDDVAQVSVELTVWPLEVDTDFGCKPRPQDVYPYNISLKQTPQMFNHRKRLISQYFPGVSPLCTIFIYLFILVKIHYE